MPAESRYSLKFPFWITSNRREADPPDNTPCDNPKAPHGFTSMEKLSAFMSARKAGSWKVELIAGREDLMLAIADVHELEIDSICFDPESDGSGGESIPLREIPALCR